MSESPRPCPICELPKVESLGRRPNHAIYSFRCLRCGGFELNRDAGVYVGQLDEEVRMRVSVALRQASAQGNPLVLDSSLIASLGNELPRRRPLLEGADEVLLYLANLAPSHFVRIRYSSSHDHTLLGFTTERGMQDAQQALEKLGYLSELGIEITVEGWMRIEELRREQPNSRKAFVAMWLDEEMEAAWAGGFEPGIRDTEFFEPVRMSGIEHVGKIDDRIIAEIRTSGLLVADFTGHRGGVYYEAGFAAGLDVPVIWCCRKDHFDKVHFDTRQYNHIVWTEPSELREKLRNRILAVVPAATRG